MNIFDSDKYILFGVMLGLVIGFLSMGLLARYTDNNLFVNTGDTFCKSYGLEYSAYEIKNDVLKFKCINQTSSKIDGIGLLISSK